MFLCCLRFLKLNMRDYYKTCFMDFECYNLYCVDFLKTKLCLERGIYLDRKSEKLLDFHDHLVDIGKKSFALDPCQDNDH